MVIKILVLMTYLQRKMKVYFLKKKPQIVLVNIIFVCADVARLDKTLSNHSISSTTLYQCISSINFITIASLFHHYTSCVKLIIYIFIMIVCDFLFGIVRGNYICHLFIFFIFPISLDLYRIVLDHQLFKF